MSILNRLPSSLQQGTSFPSSLIRNIFQQITLSNALTCITIITLLYWGVPLLYGLFIEPTKGVPGPFWARVTRWWEYCALIKGDSHLWYIHLHEAYGPIVRVGPNRYSFSRPSDVKVIYEIGAKFVKTDFYSVLSHPEPDKRNIFVIKEPSFHKERRRKIGALYTMSTMVTYEEAVDKMTAVCVRKMRRFADEGRLISIPDFMQYYAFDVIGEITFNKSFGMMEKEGDTTEMVEGIHKANDYLAHAGLVPDLHPWITRFNALIRKKPFGATLAQYTINQIGINREGNAKATENKYDSFMKKLLDMEASNRITMSNMMDACGSNIGAGSDTTAITLSSALNYLYRYPDKLSKLRTEIDSQASKGRISDPVTFQEAQGMPYLQAVIKESLRLHPAVGTILAREVPKGGVQLGGYFFPEGTNVGANPWVLHYSKDIYGSDANKYRPERWLEKDETGLMDSMMFAFGAGSRSCIGKNISLLEMTKALPQIVRNFDIVLEDPLRPVSLDARCAWFVYPKYKAWIRPRSTIKPE